MPVYQWKMFRPEGTFEARQINSSEDLDAWIASLTENELVNDHTTYSNLVNGGVEDGRFKLSYYQDSIYDGAWTVNLDEPLGTWMIASRTNANLFNETDESFQSRFELYDS